jgi:hypothetical protein
MKGQTKDGLRLVGNASKLGVLGTRNSNKTLRQGNKFVEVAHED